MTALDPRPATAPAPAPVAEATIIPASAEVTQHVVAAPAAIESRRQDYNGWEFPGARRNLLGGVALILAVIGGLLALIQSEASVGWLLIPGSFALAVLALHLPRRSKDIASMAVIASVAGALAALVTLAFGA